MGADGSPGVFLYDKAGQVRAGFVIADRAALELADKFGRPRAILRVGADGSPSLALFDAKGDVLWQAPR